MKLRTILFFFIYLTAIAVSIKSFREPDLWWQIRTGEWILEHHEVPKQDVFSYTMAGAEWVNIKWGFEVLAAVVSDALGPESVFILQALVNCLLVFFLFKLSGLFFSQKFKHGELRINRTFLFTGVITFLLVIIATEYRMIGRPEMISHLFTVVFLFLLEKNRRQTTNLVNFLIPLQLLWANLHEAFGTGIVLMLIYTLSPLADQFLLKEKKTRTWRLALVTLAATASVIINPHGISLLARPFNILSQVYANKYTTELLDITASAWWQKEAFLALVIAIVSIAALITMKENGTGKLSLPYKIISALNQPYLLAILAFLYLGLTAYRNLIFLTLVCFPVFHYAIFSVLKKWLSNPASRIANTVEKYAGPAAVVLLAVFYAGIVSNRYYEITKSRDRFGLEVLSVNNPAGAADYILKHRLKEKKCFSDYLTSSYLLWTLQPEFKTYIDLRDLDVFPAEFFNGFLRDINSPWDFHKLDSAQKFDYAVVFRPQFDALHSYLFNDSIYALKYLDAVAAVYEKTDHFSRDDIFSPCMPVPQGVFAGALNKILNPFYTPYDYSAVENDYVAANYYLNVGRLDLAQKRAEALVQSGTRAYKGHELIGQIYFRSSVREPSDSIKNNLLAYAEESYLQSLRNHRTYAPALQGLGVVHYTQKNYTAAIKDLKKCLDLDDGNYQVHLSIAQCYRELMGVTTTRKEEYRNELLKHFLKANSLNPGNPMVQANIGFVYFQMNDCDHAIEYLSRVSGDKSLSNEDQLAIENCLRQCGY